MDEVNEVAKQLLTTHKNESAAFNKALTVMANKPDQANVDRVRKTVLALAVAALGNKPGKPQKVDGATSEICRDLQRDKMLAEDKIDVYETTMDKIVLVDKVPKKIKAHIKSMRAALAELTAEDTAEGTGEYDDRHQDGNAPDEDTPEGMSEANEDNDD